MIPSDVSLEMLEARVWFARCRWEAATSCYGRALVSGDPRRIEAARRRFDREAEHWATAVTHLDWYVFERSLTRLG